MTAESEKHAAHVDSVVDGMSEAEREAYFDTNSDICRVKGRLDGAYCECTRRRRPAAIAGEAAFQHLQPSRT